MTAAAQTIAVGSDESTPLTDAVIAELGRRGYALTLYGALCQGDARWPVVAREVGEAVARGAAGQGVLFCWTGTGVSIAANKVHGVRAALCADAETARGARMWNDANVLCLSLRKTESEAAKEILEAWLATGVDAGETANIALVQNADTADVVRGRIGA